MGVQRAEAKRKDERVDGLVRMVVLVVCLALRLGGMKRMGRGCSDS